MYIFKLQILKKIYFWKSRRNTRWNIQKQKDFFDETSTSRIAATVISRSNVNIQREHHKPQEREILLIICTQYKFCINNTYFKHKSQ